MPYIPFAEIISLKLSLRKPCLSVFVFFAVAIDAVCLFFLSLSALHLDTAVVCLFVCLFVCLLLLLMLFVIFAVAIDAVRLFCC